MNGVEQLVLFLVSLVANLFSAFSGGGAGLIQLPVLIFMGLPFTIALATHKVASVALGIGATVVRRSLEYAAKTQFSSGSVASRFLYDDGLIAARGVFGQ